MLALLINSRDCLYVHITDTDVSTYMCKLVYCMICCLLRTAVCLNKRRMLQKMRRTVNTRAVFCPIWQRSV